MMSELTRSGISYTSGPGEIMFGEGDLPGRMVSLTNPTGGVTTITYTPSSEFGVNQMPGVQQVVRSITTNDGRGGVATTSYSYVGGAYDFINRQTLGYKTVTAHLPPIAGETEGPKVTTTYLNGHLAEYGLVKSRIITQAGATLSREIFDYSIDNAGNGPWRADRTSERSATAFGSGLIETTKTRIFDLYGQITKETSLGFTSNGVSLDPSDDIIVSFGYSPNLLDYIVDRPIFRREEKVPEDPAVVEEVRVSVTNYRYDGAAANDIPPTDGNLTEVRELGLGLPSLAWRVTKKMTYDAWGNILTEQDAKGQTVATHAYDATRNLFRLSTTNALGHQTSTAWDTACQTPATVTDPNGRQSTFIYDTFCREVQSNHPGGRTKVTRYQNFGFPTQQYVEQEQSSGSTIAGRTFGLSRTYFDGLGQTYLASSPGTTSAIADSTIQISGYDARGNLAWKSIPLGWTSFGTIPSPTQRTSVTYDGLDRPLVVTNPDGSQKTTAYIRQSFTHFDVPSMAYPAIETNDEHCYDLTADNTICGRARTVLDAAGRTIGVYRLDIDKDDIDHANTTWRLTSYRYDQKGRLVAVVDPGGATWAYTYDGFGNRLTSNDPGLGFWTLTYDRNNNLLSQTDAKGQVISFTYDPLNRVLTKTVGTGTSRVETAFTYDYVRATFFNIGQETSQKVWTPSNGTIIHEVERNYHVTGSLQAESHIIDGRRYDLASTIASTGAVIDQSLPNAPDTTVTGLTGAVSLDAAGRTTGITGLVNSITYNRASQPTLVTYQSGVTDTMVYDPSRNWVTQISGKLPGQNANFFTVNLSRTATGRIHKYDSVTDSAGAYDFTYDYAGRLLSATNFRGVPTANQVFSYDKAGRLRSKGMPASPSVYSYADPTKPDHAPSTVTVPGTTTTTTINGQTTISATPPIVTTFSYDANGNMLAMAVDNSTFAGKVMTYDAENRPLSVTYAGKKTCYVYGVDGKRLKKVENLSPTQSCTALPATTPATVYFGAVEIRNWKLAGQEQILTYPHPSVKLTYTKTGTTVAKEVSWLHRDHLGSVRAITRAGANGTVAVAERANYKPFGEQSKVITTTAPPAAAETKGWIGERYDADAGLQYLNARYYDPELGMFLQPDWLEVTKAGVGTNRYSYSFNDPINKFDPNGNQSFKEAWNGFWSTVGSFFSGAKEGGSRNADLNNTRNGAIAGATGGAIIGAGAGTSVACVASACTGAVIATPAGAGSGFLLGGLLLGGAGLILDGSEVISGAIVGGYDAVVAQHKTKVAAVKTPDPKDGGRLLAKYNGMVSTGLGTHANSLMSPNKTELYHLLRSSNPTIIDKIGITSAPGGGPTGRYTQDELRAMGVLYVPVQVFNDRLSARVAEVAANLNYFSTHGTLPKYTFQW